MTAAAPAARVNRLVVSVAEAVVSADPSSLVVTHALGSCLGIVLHDASRRIGGIFHPMLPSSSVSPAKAAENPFLCVDSGFPVFWKKFLAAGGGRGEVIVKVAGGGRMYATKETDFFDIGRRNFLALRKVLWSAGLLIGAECVGGTRPQTVFLHVGSGRTQVSIGGEVRDL